MKAGDPVTVTELYEEHKTELVQRLTAYSRDFHSAEDAVQQAYLKALTTGVTDGLSERSAAAWLYTTARNALTDEMRRRTRLTLLDSDAETSVTEPNADDMLLLRALLEKLTPEQREVVSLRYLTGLTSAEIGAMTSLPPATVRTRLKAAMKRLRGGLDMP